MKSTHSGIIIQAASSISNALLVLSISRAEDPAAFGVFTLGYAVLAMLISLMRSSIFDLILIKSSDRRDDADRDVLGLLLLLSGLLVILAILSLCLDANGTYRYIWLIMAFSPLVLFQDFGRFIAIAGHEHLEAVKSDVFWVIGALLILFLPVGGESKLMLWMAVAAVSAVLNRTFVRAAQNFLSNRQGLPNLRIETFSWAFLLDNVMLTARGSLVLSVFVATYGSRVAAIIGICHFLFQPLGSLVQGLRFTYLRASKNAGSIKGNKIYYVYILAILSAFIWGAVVHALPAEFTANLIGESYLELYPVFWVVALFEIARLSEHICADWFKLMNFTRALVSLRFLSLVGLFGLCGFVAAGFVGTGDLALFYRSLIGGGVAFFSIGLIAFVVISQRRAAEKTVS